MSAPLVIDLCCGEGGWTAGFLAEGFRVIGFDIVRPACYPPGAQFVQQDVATVSGAPMRGRVAFIVASPPCTEFSQVWSYAKHRAPRPEEGIELVRHCERIQQECGAPMLLENVRGAQQYIGAAAAHVGPYYLWGSVPLLLPYGNFQKGIWNTQRGYNTKAACAARRTAPYVRNNRLRARIPIELARAVAQHARSLD